MSIPERVTDLWGRVPKRVTGGSAAAEKATASLHLQESITLEASADAAYKAANAPEIQQKSRERLAQQFEPPYNTRCFQLVYGETLPIEFYPFSRIGWVLTGITVYPAIKTDFTVATPAVIHIHGMDENSDMYLSVGSTPYHIAVKRRVYGSSKWDITLLGTGATILSPVMVDFVLEDYSRTVITSGGE